MTLTELRCPSCTAPLDPSIQRCRYCGASLALEGASGAGGASFSKPANAGFGLHVFMEDCGPHKIAVIKVLRAALKLGLKEAKELAESAPCVVLEGADPARTRKLRDELVQAGARVR